MSEVNVNDIATKYLTISFSAHHAALLMAELDKQPPPDLPAAQPKHHSGLLERVLGDVFNLTESVRFCDRTRNRPRMEQRRLIAWAYCNSATAAERKEAHENGRAFSRNSSTALADFAAQTRRERIQRLIDFAKKTTEQELQHLAEKPKDDDSEKPIKRQKVKADEDPAPLEDPDELGEADLMEEDDDDSDHDNDLDDGDYVDAKPPDNEVDDDEIDLPDAADDSAASQKAKKRRRKLVHVFVGGEGQWGAPHVPFAAKGLNALVREAVKELGVVRRVQSETTNN